jgi:hypothetical protein
MQRYSDARCFSAWVVSLDEHSIVVEVPDLRGLDVGDKFLFQVSAMVGCVMFEAQLKKMDGTSLCFQILSPIKLRPPYEDARIRTSYEGVARLAEDAFRVWIDDVSASGMGLLSERSLERWQTICVVAKTAYGGAKVEGQVCYCKPLSVGDWP